MRTSSPSVFSTTVFPPAFGPVIIITLFLSIDIFNATAFSFPNFFNSKGCLPSIKEKGFLLSNSGKLPTISIEYFAREKMESM